MRRVYCAHSASTFTLSGVALALGRSFIASVAPHGHRAAVATRVAAAHLKPKIRRKSIPLFSGFMSDSIVCEASPRRYAPRALAPVCAAAQLRLSPPASVSSVG